MVLKKACAAGQLNSSAAFLKRFDHGVLVRHLQPHEGLAVGLAAIRIELCQPAAIKILKVGIRSGEREVDVIEHSRVTRARLVRRTRHQPFGDRRDRLGIGVVEKGSMIIAVRMDVWGRCRSRRCGRRVGLSRRFGQQLRTCNNPRT